MTRFQCLQCPSIIFRTSRSGTQKDQFLGTPAPLAAGQYHIFKDKFEFENIAVSRPRDGQVFLACADVQLILQEELIFKCESTLGFQNDEGCYLVADELVRESP